MCLAGFRIVVIVWRVNHYENRCNARALGESIFTQADTEIQLHAMIRDAVLCHFDEGEAPKILHLNMC